MLCCGIGLVTNSFSLCIQWICSDDVFIMSFDAENEDFRTALYGLSTKPWHLSENDMHGWFETKQFVPQVFDKWKENESWN